MIRCKKCLIPTKPGVEFVDGVCPACIRFEARSNINWTVRQDYLKNLCNEHRKYDGSYDCIIPVSGGKDSFFQVYTLKHKFNMNPLLVCVTDPFTHTPEGTHNYKTIASAFNCDMITLALDPNFIRESTLITLEHLGCTNWAVDKAIYAWPLQVAIEKGIKLLIYGENVSWMYGGPNATDTWDANGQINNNVVQSKGEELLSKLKPCKFLQHPSAAQLEDAGIQSIYLSWFYPWNDLENVEIAKKYGFKTLDSWQRMGYIDDYAQIDSVAYLQNYYLKFMKYGIGRVVDIGSRWVRYGIITKEELADKIRKEEGAYDETISNDFCTFMGWTQMELIKKSEKWWNKDIFNTGYIRNVAWE